MNINEFLLLLFLFYLTLYSVDVLSIFKTNSQEDGQTDVDPILIEVTWTAHDYNLHTIPSLQVVTNPLVSRQFSPISSKIFANLKQLNAEYTRYAFWYPYPKLAVAELDPPSGLFQCGNVGENYSIHLSCEQNNGIISKINFASFGTAVGACGQMKRGTCDAVNSLDIIQRACLRQQKCSVTASTDLFGDPCKCYSGRRGIAFVLYLVQIKSIILTCILF